MERTSKYALALVTAPNLRVARQLTQLALRARLIACANLTPQVESHYWWQGKIEKGTEILLIMKTTRAKLGALEKLIMAKHPYETPEFLVLPVVAGSVRYMRWITDSVEMK